MNAGDGFFVDSNLLLYYIDPGDAAKRERATEWLEALWMAGSGRLSWQVLHEFYWNAVKKMRLAPAAAREIVEAREHLGLRDGIQRRGGLIQNEHLSIAKIRAREREFLPLAAREIHSALETPAQHLIQSACKAGK